MAVFQIMEKFTSGDIGQQQANNIDYEVEKPPARTPSEGRGW
jgi:hypothetical protein